MRPTVAVMFFTLALTATACSRGPKVAIPIYDPMTLTRIHARATVPFLKIVHVLQASQLTELQTRYLVRGVDVFGARLRLRYRDGFTFDSEAPDRTQWWTRSRR